MNGRVMCGLSAAASALTGAAYTLCLVRAGDAATGFVTGGVLPWYLAFGVCAALALAAGRAVAADAPPRAARGAMAPFWALWAAASAVQAAAVAARAVAGADLPDAAHNTPLYTLLIQGGGALCGGLFLLWAAFCARTALVLRAGRPLPGGLLWLGMAGSCGNYLYLVLRFLMKPASWQRITVAAGCLGALCALLAAASALRALFLPKTPKAARRLAGTGLLAFAFGVCLCLPQGLWQLAAGAGWDGLAAGAYCTAAGLAGLAGARGVLAAGPGKAP